MSFNPAMTGQPDDSAVFAGHKPSRAANPKIVKFIDKVDQLPPSPRLLIKLLELFKQPDQDIEEVVKLITFDPPYTAEVLRRCNSVYFAGAEPVQGISEAVSRLGFEELHKLVTAIFASNAILRPGHHSFVDVLWNHSASVAVAAGVLAEQFGESALTAFTAGLLHEVGKVIMITVDEENYVQTVQTSGMFKRPIYVAEKELFGFDHAEVGACLLERWNLPPNIVAAILHHHQLEGAEPFERLSAVICLANILSHSTGETFATMPKELPNAAEAMEILNATPGKVFGLLPAMQEALKKARSLSRPPGGA
jgi:putative nucleotidyltransferase with HDIG domain